MVSTAGTQNSENIWKFNCKTVWYKVYGLKAMEMFRNTCIHCFMSKVGTPGFYHYHSKELYLAQLVTHQWWILPPHGILLLQVLVQLTQLVLDHWKPLTLHRQSLEVENEAEGSHHIEDIPGARLKYAESVVDALVIPKLAQQQWAQSFQKDHDILQLAGLCTGKQKN